MHGLVALTDAPCTRRHALKVFAASAGAALLGPLPGLRAGPRLAAAAEPPWGETLAAPLGPDGKPLRLGTAATYGRPRRAAEPVLACDPAGGRLWTAWTEPQDGRDAIVLRAFDPAEGEWAAPLILSCDDDEVPLAAHDCELVLIGARALVVWSQRDQDGWSIRVRAVELATGAVGPLVTLTRDTGLRAHPVAAVCGDRVLVAWQAEDVATRTYSVQGRRLDATGQPLGDVRTLAADAGRDCAWPALAADGRRFALAWDRDDGAGAHNVYLTLIDPQTGEPEAPRPVSHHPARNYAPALAFARGGAWLWVAWHTDRRGEDGWDIPRWYRLAALRLSDRTWHVPAGVTFVAPDTARGTVQGFELVRLAVSPGGVVVVLGRASQNFYVQYFAADGASPIYRLPEDGWGGRGRLLRGVFDGAGALWVARRDLNTHVLHRVDGFADLAGSPPLAAWDEPARTARPRLVGVTRRDDWPRPGAAQDLKLLLGDLHGHTWQSDGMGDPRECYLRARDVYADDFHVVTDHDEFVAKRLTDGQWEEQKALAEHYHVPGRFVTLFGQEWTTPRTTVAHGWGHLNLYSADPAMPLLPHTEPRYRDLPDLYPVLRAHGAIAIPHHTGWTGVKWDALDPELVPVIEVCSAHGAYEYPGNEPIPHRGDLAGCFLRDGLAADRRVGVVGGSDQHGLAWHHGVCWKRDVYRAGLTGIWATDCTRAALLDALRQRRTFATSGVKLGLYFAVGGTLMGGTVTCGGPPEIEADVAVPPEEGRLAWLQIVRDGAVIRRVGSEGPRTRLAFRDEAAGPGTHWYYARVVLADGNQAWSSAVWATVT